VGLADHRTGSRPKRGDLSRSLLTAALSSTSGIDMDVHPAFVREAEALGRAGGDSTQSRLQVEAAGDFEVFAGDPAELVG